MALNAAALDTRIKATVASTMYAKHYSTCMPTHLLFEYGKIGNESQDMGHSDISVTMNVCTHIGFDDAEEELKRMEEFRKEQADVEQKKEKPMSQKMFKVF